MIGDWSKNLLQLAAVSAALVLAACLAKPGSEDPLRTITMGSDAPQEILPKTDEKSQTGPTFAHSDCLAAAERLQAEKNTVFSGFAESTSLQEASNLAAADLVSQIQTRISSQGTTQESNRSVVMSNLTETTVDALLTGLITEKRCRSGSRWESVVKLERAVFFRNILMRISPVIREAQVLRDSLVNPSILKGEKLSLAAKAKAFIKSEGIPARDLFVICRTFQSCTAIDADIVDDISRLADRIFSGFAFNLKFNDGEALAIKEPISRMLGEEGFALSESVTVLNAAAVSCQRKDFPPMAQTGFMVTELVCSVMFSDDAGRPVAGLVRTYRGHGLGESREEALREARRKLEKIT